MLTKRFSLAKEVRGEINTPKLLRCGEDVFLEDDTFHFLGREIKRRVLYPQSIRQEEIKIDNGLYLIPNILDLLRDTGEFVRYTMGIREKYGYNAIFYAPGVPENLLPVLFYMGYDIFDDCLSKIQCHELWGPSENCGDSAGRIFDMAVRAFHEDRLREFVEGIPDNKSQEILRHLDFEYYDEVEQFYPVHMNSVNAVTVQSLYRPDILRWKRRLKERYRKPKFARHLLLIPCSARKPYSESKSHRFMRRFIKASMHEVILTSPLGLVPRELERFYPAGNYDIPVVGRWYEEEKSLITELLRWYLESFEYESVISFLPESMKFLEEILREHGATMIWGRDYDALARETKKIDYRVRSFDVMRDGLESLARFQFGLDFDFSAAKLRGRFPKVDILKEGERYFGFDIHRGMLTLTRKSAMELAEASAYSVEIDDFMPEGDVFAAGIMDTTPEIRIGDEVAVVHRGELRAWGTARMSSYDMRTQNRGKAIKIRGKNQ